MQVFHWVGGLLFLGVIFGIGLQALNNPQGSTALLMTGADSYTGVVHALEGKG